MAETVIQPASYVIRQYDGTTPVSEEFMPASTPVADVQARAMELEFADPNFQTVWYLRGEVTETQEDIPLPGTVIEKDVGTKRFFDIEGATAETATVNDGAELPLLFMLEDPQPGDVIKFFDENGVQVAEVML